PDSGRNTRRHHCRRHRPGRYGLRGSRLGGHRHYRDLDWPAPSGGPKSEMTPPENPSATNADNQDLLALLGAALDNPRPREITDRRDPMDRLELYRWAVQDPETHAVVLRT